MKRVLPVLSVFFVVCMQVWAAPPVLTNLSAGQRDWGVYPVDVYYSAADAEGRALSVSAVVLTNGVPMEAESFTGDIGVGITPGSGKKLTWDAPVDFPEGLCSNVQVNVTAEAITPFSGEEPDGMAFVPAGEFQMGNSSANPYFFSDADELPVHTVYVSAFWMDEFEVSWTLWNEVRDWGLLNGYTDLAAGAAKGADHPVYSVDWNEAVKWCNARSEREGCEPVYYTDSTFTMVYRKGVAAPYAKWSANGYRLPTEAEWEKAARGGVEGKRFAFGDLISHADANYLSTGLEPYDLIDLGGGPAVIRAQDFEDATLDGWGYSTKYFNRSAVEVFVASNSSVSVSTENPRRGEKALRLQGSVDGSVAPAVVFNNVDLRNFRNVQLSIPHSAVGPDSGDDLQITLSYDGGMTWVTIHGTTNAFGTYVVDAPDTNTDIPYDTVLSTNAQPGGSPYIVNIPDSAEQVMFRLIFFNAAPSYNLNDFYDIDDVSLTGTPVVFSQGFDEAGADENPWTYSINYYDNSGNVISPAPSSPVEEVVASPVYSGSGAFRLQGAPNGGTNGAIVFDNVDISGYTNVALSFYIAAQNVDSSDTLRIMASTNAGATWFSPDGSGAASTLGRAIGVGQKADDSWTYGAGTAAQCPNGNPYVWQVPDEYAQLMFRVSFGGQNADNTSDYYFIDEVKLFGQEIGEDFVMLYHPDFEEGEVPHTAPVDSFAPNGYGLYNMNGNAWEWCWDWFSTNANFYAAYTNANPLLNAGYLDPKGLASGDFRVLRGGAWHAMAWYARNSWRGAYDFQSYTDIMYSFRTVRSASEIRTEDVAQLTSSNFVVDTRSDMVMKVTDVSSRYCNGAYGGTGSRAYFLQGVDLTLDFTVSAAPGRKTIQSVVFNGVTQSWSSAKKSFNVGQFKAGGSLKVFLVATDGTRSAEFRANFDVMKVLPPFGEKLFVLETNSVLSYRITTNAPLIQLFAGKSGSVSDSVPLPESGFSISPHFRAEAVISGSAGTFTIQAARTNIGLYNKVKSTTVDDTFGKFAGTEFNMDVGGKVIADWKPGTTNWTVRSGQLTAYAYGHYTTSSYYIYATPPIYLKANIDAELALALLIQNLGTGSGWTPQFTARSDTFPKLTGVLGIGASSLLAVEGSVSVSGAFTFSAPPAVCSRLGVKGAVGAQLCVLGWRSSSLNIWSGTYWIIGNSTSALSLIPEDEESGMLLLVTSDDFAPMSRDYLARPRSFVRPTAAADGESVVVVADGYPYPAPVLTANGAALLYLRDNPLRSDENRTELVESRLTGGVWSAPAAVWDDGTGDYSPQAVELPDGTLLAVWANSGAVLQSGSTLDDHLAALEIAVGERTPAGQWSAFNLTQNAALDHSPLIAADAAGNAVVVWLRNADNDWQGRGSNSFHAAIRTNGVWSAGQLVAEDVGLVPYFDLACTDGEATLVYARDADGDIGTPEDQELFAIQLTGGGWGAPVQLTDNDAQDTRPYARYDSQGNLMVLWHQDGSLLAAANQDFTNAAVIGELGLSSGARDFKLITGAQGQMGVIWQDTDDGSAGIPDPYILNYDPLSGLWSKPVRLLENGRLERDFSGLYAANGELQLAHVQVDVEFVDDEAQFGAADLVVLTHAVGPDPAIDEASIQIAADSSEPRTPVGISFAVKNLGELAVSNLAVRLYNGNPAGSADALGDDQIIPLLPGGGTATVTFPWFLPDTEDNVALYAVVDPDALTDDRNRANNAAQILALMPDLVLQDASAIKESRTLRRIRATVQNEGAVRVPGGTRITYRWDDPQGAIFHQENDLGILEAARGNAYDSGFLWNMTNDVFTTPFVTVCATVNPDETPEESTYENNTITFSIITPLDSDNDGLLDGEEIDRGTDPYSADTDGDGLNDYDEATVHHTDPLNVDTDGDGFSDFMELQIGTDPNNAASLFTITGIDGAETTVPQVRWLASPGITYQVQWTTNILDTNSWADLPGGTANQTAGIGDDILIHTLPTMDVTNSFYRVIIPDTP